MNKVKHYKNIATVSSRLKALNRLSDYFKNSLTEANIMCKQCIEDIELECNCGDAIGLKGYLQNDDTTNPVTVIICKSCANGN